MVMYEFIKSLREDVGKDVRIQFYDEKGDYAFDGKIESMSSDGRIMLFAHNPMDAEKMNSTYSKINLGAVIIRGVDYLDMPTLAKMKQVKQEAIATLPCPKCRTPIFMVNPKFLDEEPDD